MRLFRSLPEIVSIVIEYLSILKTRHFVKRFLRVASVFLCLRSRELKRSCLLEYLQHFSARSLSIRVQQFNIAAGTRSLMETMRSNDVRRLQDGFIRSVSKVEDIILDLEGHARRPPELLDTNQISSVNASNGGSYSRCRSKQRRCLQVRNRNTLTDACVEVSKNIEKFPLTNIDQRCSNHPHYFGILVVGQQLDSFRSEKKT